MIHIMMATYNGGKYIKEQIESILKQTYSEWKLYISDDCSSDNTIEILEAYTQKYPEKIKILKSGFSCGGSKENFAYLLEHCPVADYYMFSDQDDVWKSNKLEKMMEEVRKEERHTPLLVYSDLEVVDENLQRIDPSYFHYQGLFMPKEHRKSRILMNNYVPGCVMLFNDALRRNAGEVPEECPWHDWWLVMIATYTGKIIKIPESLNYYRQHGNNQVGSQQNSVKKDVGNILKGIFSGEVIKRMNSICDQILNERQYQLDQRLYTRLEGIAEKEDLKIIENHMYLFVGKKRFKKIKILFKNHFLTESLLSKIYLCTAVIRGMRTS